MKTTTKEWLLLAHTDIRSCENNLEDEYVTNIVAFHCQQAIEKCFKAIIEENNINFQRTHSLFRLHKLIENEIDFDIDLNQLENIDEIYTSSRYPSDFGILEDGKPSLNRCINS